MGEALYGVLTGDLVASSKAGPQATDRAMQAVSGAAAEIALWPISDTSAVGDTHFTRFRGDGWQIIVPAACYSLRAALLIYARLAARPDLPVTRIAVGISTIASIPGQTLADAHGAAFAVSGRALSGMSGAERIRVAGDGITPSRISVVALLNDRLSDWTAEQAEAVSHAIAPGAPTQAAIAARLGISPQALSYRLAGAKWPTLRRVLAAWEQSLPPDETRP